MVYFIIRYLNIRIIGGGLAVRGGMEESKKLYY